MKIRDDRKYIAHSDDAHFEESVDELELPIAVADTARELGKIIGKTENAIFKTVEHYKFGKNKRKKICPYVRVEI